MEKLSFTGRTALITGGAGGIGRATALVCARRGADIVVLDTNAEALSQLAGDLADAPGTILTYTADVSVEADIRSVFEDARAKTGRIDILVNNVGIGARTPATEIDTETWSRVMDVNLTSAFVCSREFARQCAPERGGAIVNIASIMGMVGNPLYPNIAYHASKGGLVNMTRALAAEWAAKNIRVNAVLPSFVETALTRPLLSENAMRRDILDRTPQHRFAEPEDIAEAVAFLASDAAKMITGALLPVDGGWLAV